jgi:hypothetical protein
VKLSVLTAISVIVLVVAAFAIRRASGLVWAAAWAPDGTRYKVSPRALLHVLRPHQTTSPVVICRWHGDAVGVAACSVVAGEGIALGRLKLADPLLGLAFWLAVASAVAAVLPWVKPGHQYLSQSLAITAAGAVFGAVGLVASNAPRALAALSDLALGYGALGFTLICAAPILLGWAGGLLGGASPLRTTSAVVGVVPVLVPVWAGDWVSSVLLALLAGALAATTLLSRRWIVPLYAQSKSVGRSG